MYSSTGNLNSAPAAPPMERPRESLLESLNQNMQQALKELHGGSVRLHNLADRVIGTRPEAAGVGETNAPVGSSMQSLERSVNGLQNLARMVSDAAERLERL